MAVKAAEARVRIDPARGEEAVKAFANANTGAEIFRPGSPTVATVAPSCPLHPVPSRRRLGRENPRDTVIRDSPPPETDPPMSARPVLLPAVVSLPSSDETPSAVSDAPLRAVLHAVDTPRAHPATS